MDRDAEDLKKLIKWAKIGVQAVQNGYIPIDEDPTISISPQSVGEGGHFIPVMTSQLSFDQLNHLTPGEVADLPHPSLSQYYSSEDSTLFNIQGMTMGSTHPIYEKVNQGVGGGLTTSRPDGCKNLEKNKIQHTKH